MVSAPVNVPEKWQGYRYALLTALARYAEVSHDTAAIDLRWQSKDGQWSNAERNQRTFARQAGQWERLNAAATAPEGAARAVILLSAEGMEDRDRVWFDDAAFADLD